MFKSGLGCLLKPLTKLFNMVLSPGYYPPKFARIVSIYKKGDASDPANHRGITITSSLGKLLFNSILNTRMCNFLDNKTRYFVQNSVDIGKKHRTSEIWSPLGVSYKYTKGPRDEKASSIKDIRGKLPYITMIVQRKYISYAAN
jgi:hypothetical protein